MLSRSSPQLMASGRDLGGGEGLKSCSRGRLLRFWPHSREYRNWPLLIIIFIYFFYFFFEGRSHKGDQTWKDWEGIVIVCMTWNSQRIDKNVTRRKIILKITTKIGRQIVHKICHWHVNACFVSYTLFEECKFSNTFAFDAIFLYAILGL